MLFEVMSDITDFVGDVSENITDAVFDVGECVGEFCRKTMEGVGYKEMEALKNNDLKGFIEYSDMPGEQKESAKRLVEYINPAVISGVKTVGGSIAVIGALATPGFQPMGVKGLSIALQGAKELASQLNSNQNLNAFTYA